LIKAEEDVSQLGKYGFTKAGAMPTKNGRNTTMMSTRTRGCDKYKKRGDGDENQRKKNSTTNNPAIQSWATWIGLDRVTGRLSNVDNATTRLDNKTSKPFRTSTTGWARNLDTRLFTEDTMVELFLSPRIEGSASAVVVLTAKELRLNSPVAGSGDCFSVREVVGDNF
jgi:hypothetical protein